MQTDIAHHKSATLNSWFYNLQIPVYHAIYHLGLKKNADKLSLTKKSFVWSLITNSKDILRSAFAFMRKKSSLNMTLQIWIDAFSNSLALKYFVRLSDCLSYNIMIEQYTIVFTNFYYIWNAPIKLAVFITTKR